MPNKNFSVTLTPDELAQITAAVDADDRASFASILREGGLRMAKSILRDRALLANGALRKEERK